MLFKRTEIEAHFFRDWPCANILKMSGARQPLFIHAGWRTGSTYIWKKYREQPRYRAYLEPLHEALLAGTEEQLRRDLTPEFVSFMRHPEIERFYFDEYPFRPEGGVEYFEPHFPYERYCLDPAGEDEALERYISNLILRAEACGQTAVLQFNRSLLRSEWMKERFAPISILILRRPEEIWNSFLSFPNRYFPGVVCCILGQNSQSRLLQDIAARFGIPLQITGLSEDIEFYRQFAIEHLDALYPAFYEFYILTSAYNCRLADCIIDVDEVSSNPDVRAEVMRRLENMGAGISLDDCRVPAWHGHQPEADVLERLLGRGFPELRIPDTALAAHRDVLSDYFLRVFSEFNLRQPSNRPSR